MFVISDGAQAAELCERVIPNNDYADFKYGG